MLYRGGGTQRLHLRCPQFNSYGGHHRSVVGIEFHASRFPSLNQAEAEFFLMRLFTNSKPTAKEIDHVLVNTRWNVVQQCRVYRSMKFVNIPIKIQPMLDSAMENLFRKMQWDLWAYTQDQRSWFWAAQMFMEFA